jgi:hypothetical protein
LTRAQSSVTQPQSPEYQHVKYVFTCVCVFNGCENMLLFISLEELLAYVSGVWMREQSRVLQAQSLEHRFSVNSE